MSTWRSRSIPLSKPSLTSTGRCWWWTPKAAIGSGSGVSPERPHGLDYSLTLHGPDGERLVGFDNAHPVGRRKRGEPHDHRHRLRSIRPYEYRDAATLLADFWETVDAVLRERGVIP